VEGDARVDIFEVMAYYERDESVALRRWRS